jgi:hypothetical protein
MQGLLSIMLAFALSVSLDTRAWGLLSPRKVGGSAVGVGIRAGWRRLHQSAGGSMVDHAEQAIVSHQTSSSVLNLQQLRPGLRIYDLQGESNVSGSSHSYSPYWVSYRRGIQLDCCQLDESLSSSSYHMLPPEKELAFSWDSALYNRIRHLVEGEHQPTPHQLNRHSNKYYNELSAALCAVHRSSFVARSLQHILVGCKGPHSATEANATLEQTSQRSIAKPDSTPVTIADFVVQALIIDVLSRHFPDDIFVAEEDSALLKERQDIRDQVKFALEAATGKVNPRYRW